MSKLWTSQFLFLFPLFLWSLLIFFKIGNGFGGEVGIDFAVALRENTTCLFLYLHGTRKNKLFLLHFVFFLLPPALCNFSITKEKNIVLPFFSFCFCSFFLFSALFVLFSSERAKKMNKNRSKEKRKRNKRRKKRQKETTRKKTNSFISLL